MPMKPCADCGKQLKVNAKSAPEPRCHGCRAKSRNRKVPPSGQPGYIAPSRRMDCTGCGKTISRTKTSAAEPYCAGCRKAGLAPSMAKHGTSRRYKAGCRCDLCRASHNGRMREYALKRIAEGRSLEAARRSIERECAHCGGSFMVRRSAVLNDEGIFCSVDCAKRSQGWDGTPRDRFRPSAALRAKIIDRDGGECQLCGSPVREDVDVNHPRYPHLDHVMPRSRGGSDDEANLRLACRQCNVLRGSNVDWVPEVADVAA